MIGSSSMRVRKNDTGQGRAFARAWKMAGLSKENANRVYRRAWTATVEFRSGFPNCSEQTASDNLPRKKLGGTAFATPPYKTRRFFYLNLLCLIGTSCQSASPKKPWPIEWYRWRVQDRSFRTVFSRGPLDAMPRFPSQILRAPAAYAGTSTWRSA